MDQQTKAEDFDLLPKLTLSNIIINKPDENFNVNDNILNVPSTSTKSITEKMDLPALEDKADEITDPAVRERAGAFLRSNRAGISKMRESNVTSLPAEDVNEITDQTFNSKNELNEPKVNPGPNIDEITEIMDLQDKLPFEENNDEMVKQITNSISITEEYRALTGPNTVDNSKIVNVEIISVPVEELSEATDQPTDCTNSSKSEIILSTNTVGNNEINDEEITPDQSTTDHVIMHQAAENICEKDHFANIFNLCSQEGTLKRNLEVIPGTSTEFNSTESAMTLGSFKTFTTSSIERVRKTPTPESNVSMFVQEYAESSKILNAAVNKLKDFSNLKRKNRKRKAPPVSEMVMASIKKIKSSDGVSFEEIKKSMEENYPVKVKALMKYHICNFLQKTVDDGFLEKIDAIGEERKYIIKEENYLPIYIKIKRKTTS